MAQALKIVRDLGAEFGEVRAERRVDESIRTKNLEVEVLSRRETAGIGIRVLYKGFFGFAATSDLRLAALRRTARKALAIAKAAASLGREPGKLAPEPVHRGAYVTPVKKDPLSVPIQEKLTLLFSAAERILKVQGVVMAKGTMSAWRSEKWFANTEGTEVHQVITTCGAGIDIIIDGSQMALQVHESLGHPAELDRVLGTELSYAGGSFLTLEKLGLPRSSGAARASTWARIPLIRMTNINLLPGKGKLSDLIADTEYGIYLETNKSWSIDDRRVNFQFGTEIAWEIKNGKTVRILKNALYTGITPEFWRSCVAICGPEEWRLWGPPNCGKGEPGQVMQVGHGAAPAKFRNVQVRGAG